MVPTGQARLRVCLFPQHTKAHMDKFVVCFEESLIISQNILDTSMDNFAEQMAKEHEAKEQAKEQQAKL